MTHSPFSEGLAGLEAKRILGGLNYYFGRRGQRFKGSGERLSRLLADIDAAQVDHALCTGDLTSMSFGAEFVEARGGKVVLVKLLPGRSTTNVVEKIRGKR